MAELDRDLTTKIIAAYKDCGTIQGTANVVPAAPGTRLSPEPLAGA